MEFPVETLGHYCFDFEKVKIKKPKSNTTYPKQFRLSTITIVKNCYHLRFFLPSKFQQYFFQMVFIALSGRTQFVGINLKEKREGRIEGSCPRPHTPFTQRELLVNLIKIVINFIKYLIINLILGRGERILKNSKFYEIFTTYSKFYHT